MRRIGQIERERRQLARALENASGQGRWLGRRRLEPIDAVVRAACMPSLRTIAAALRTVGRPIHAEGIAAVQAFVTAAGSPLYGHDAGEAVREAVRLQHLVIEAHTTEGGSDEQRPDR